MLQFPYNIIYSFISIFHLSHNMNWLKTLRWILMSTLITTLFYLILISVNSRLNPLDYVILPENKTTIQSTISTTTKNYNQLIPVSPQSIFQTINFTQINYIHKTKLHLQDDNNDLDIDHHSNNSNLNFDINSIPISQSSIQSTVNLNQIRYIHNSLSTCNKSASLQLLVVVISSPENEERRNNLRNTWMKPLSILPNTAFIFFIGRSKNNSINENVKTEANATNDIIIADFEESYRNLSVKTILMLRWVKDYCPNANFILKVDDDMLINIYNLLDFINSKELSNSTIYGRLAHNWPPIRNNDSKWVVTRKEYAKSVYPDFVTGPAYLLGAKYITKLWSACIRLPYLYLEDVFITGVCAEEAKISRKKHVGFINESISGGRCKILQIISIHEVYGMRLKRLWTKLSDSNLYQFCNIKKPELIK